MEKIWISKQGFTLIELMLIVAIIGILASIAVPKLAGTMRHAREAQTKGNLGALRSSLAIYSAGHDGLLPNDNLQSLVTEGYLKEIPYAYFVPNHPPGNDVDTGAINAMDDSKESWFYDHFPALPDKFDGQIFANCNHEDLNGRKWNQL